MKILSLRGEIAELGGAIRQLQRSGMDIADVDKFMRAFDGEPFGPRDGRQLEVDLLI